ncbi:lipopolysaccharide/colanic/teichoic acid biosynthesis glycosyltransferase [Microbacterium laevaniformans]|uniref:sugar transferase n=1 Tax=Microbacterium laevaniformans TaxID=36807 RepID=UPI001D80BCC7|nr:sugar transferase [Microbacterium laevaniformans]MBM7751584.1 lipopolysaccharide/colanic/teichoic acid biosynthesis glycosyltransferase [Microbacterium laevaniformans]
MSAVDRPIRATGADTVAVTSTDELPPDKGKEISGGLEAGKQPRVLAPGVVDLAGPRIHVRPVSGLPLVHVETPRFSKRQLFAKRTLGLAAAVLGVILISPLLLFVSIAVRLARQGPVFLIQIRTGLRAQEVTMIKFRSMVVSAESLLEQLAKQECDAGNEALFKTNNDPRITAIGRVIQKYSLDELLKLFSVIARPMSLVGPRHPLPSEVAQYADRVHRRSLAEPGITGFRQASGRSLLPGDESVRLDLSYVKNWTFVGDTVILLDGPRPPPPAPGETAAQSPPRSRFPTKESHELDAARRPRLHAPRRRLLHRVGFPAGRCR